MQNSNLTIHIFEENDNTFFPYLIRAFKATLYTFLISSFVFGLFQSLRRNSFNGFSDGIFFGALSAIVLIPTLFMIDVGSRVVYYFKHKKLDFRTIQERKLIISGDYKAAFNLFSDILKRNKRLKIEHENIDEGLILAIMQKSWRCFGERIQVKINQGSHNGKVVAILKSEPKIRSTIFDYCKNLQNIEWIMEEIKTECVIERPTTGAA